MIQNNENPQKREAHITSIGGQALIEGIMMRGPKGTALALRLPDGEISTEYKTYTPLKEKHKWMGWPIIRGVFGMVDSMKLGYACLMESAEKAGIEEEGEPGRFEKWLTRVFGDKLMNIIMGFAAVLGIALAVFLFMWLPTFVFNMINTHLAGGAVAAYRALIEGAMRIGIFVAYIALCSRMKEIHRVFQYHGAEHKTIFCYENGLELTVENVKKQSRFHPRCGTSFIFVILMLSIILSSVISNVFPILTENSIVWVLIKLLMILPVMGFGYEFIKYAGKHTNRFTRIVSAPGLWMQRLTTKEPTDDIIEVGIASIQAVMTDNPDDDRIK